MRPAVLERRLLVGVREVDGDADDVRLAVVGRADTAVVKVVVVRRLDNVLLVSAGSSVFVIRITQRPSRSIQVGDLIEGGRLVVVDALWHGGDLAVADELYAPDFTANGQRVGPAGVKEALRRLRAALSEMRYELQEQIVAGDRFVVRWEKTGRHTEPEIRRLAGSRQRGTGSRSA